MGANVLGFDLHFIDSAGVPDQWPYIYWLRRSLQNSLENNYNNWEEAVLFDLFICILYKYCTRQLQTRFYENCCTSSLRAKYVRLASILVNTQPYQLWCCEYTIHVTMCTEINGTCISCSRFCIKFVCVWITSQLSDSADCINYVALW